MSFLDKILPNNCCLCQRTVSDQSICGECRPRLAPLTDACRQCARPLENADSAICGQCQKFPPQYDRSYAAFRYESPIDELITGLKFNGKLNHARTLAEEFCQANPELKANCLIPMPLYPKRTRERGFNQSLELAHALSKITGIPVDYRCCERIRPTLPQSTLKMKERRGNVSKAFSAKPDLPYQHVAIVDDVMTSGHSVNELARVLKLSTVERVDIWVMARAGA